MNQVSMTFAQLGEINPCIISESMAMHGRYGVFCQAVNIALERLHNEAITAMNCRKEYSLGELDGLGDAFNGQRIVFGDNFIVEILANEDPELARAEFHKLATLAFSQTVKIDIN